MATQKQHIFAEPREFLETVLHVGVPLEHQLYLRNSVGFQSHHLTDLSKLIDELMSNRQDRILLTLIDQDTCEDESAVGRQGAFVIDVPVICNRIATMGGFGYKAHSPEQQMWLKKMFHAAKKEFDKISTKGLEGVNIVYGGKHFYRSVWITDRMKEKFESGVCLKQRGVENVRFGPLNTVD